MVGFTRESAGRIAEATRYVERTLRNQRPWRPRQAHSPSLGFWAKITDQSTTDKKRYSWESLETKDTDELETNDDWPSGSHEDDEGYAISSDESEYVLKDAIVWLVPSKNQDYYVFEYNPGVQTAKLVSAATIPARSGSTPGSTDVTVEVYDRDSDSFSDGQDVKVFNNFQSKVEGEAGEDLYLQITYGQGVWWLSAVDCKEEDDSGGST